MEKLSTKEKEILSEIQEVLNKYKIEIHAGDGYLVIQDESQDVQIWIDEGTLYYDV